MSRDAGLLLVLGLAVGLLAGMAAAAGRGPLAALLGCGSLGLAGLALWRLRRELGSRRGNALLASLARILAGVVAAAGLQEGLLRSGVALELARGETAPLEALRLWGGRVAGPLRAVVLGPEGHRRVRAAEAVLAGLALVRPDTRVGRRDPATRGPVPGLGREARLGEVLLEAGGRRVVVADAGLRSLAAGLRALADPGHREVRLLAREQGPGAPPGFGRGAAALAQELGAAATFGPPVARARLWIWVEGVSPPVARETLEEHLAVPGHGLLVLAEARLPEGLAAALGARGLELGEAWLLDDEGGAGRGRDTLRVRRLGAGAAPGLLAGARAVRARAPAVALLEPVASGQVDLGRDPDAGGARRGRRADEGAGGRAAHGWVVLIGDRDLARDESLRQAPNRELWVELGAMGMDRTLGLPREVLVPDGGVDPALFPELYRQLAFLLLVGFPGLALMAALGCLVARAAPPR